jgi:hypothetical protein
MFEEEKLAHDVYITLYKKWNLRVFSNIANAEQTHMNAIDSLISKYNLKKSEVKSIGDFNNQKLKDLYEQLISKGNISLKNALIVGATIEDLDIHDLENYLKYTDNQDIIIVYKNLIKGSRNHLRAFTKNLNRQDENYKPQFISNKEFDSIVNSPTERGMLK